MIVFTSGNWKVERMDIAQTQTTSKEKYFVDDTTGKNHVVFDTLEECKHWISGR